MRDILRFPVTKEEAIEILKGLSRKIESEGNVGDIRPLAIKHTVKFLERTKEVELALAQLRHAYANLQAEALKDQQAFANGLIAPQIELLERFLMFGREKEKKTR